MTTTTTTEAAQQQPKRKKLVLEIRSVTFKHRIGRAGSLDTDLEHITNIDVDIQPEEHKIFGPGLRLRWRNQKGFSKFVPITNVRDVQYTETEKEE